MRLPFRHRLFLGVAALGTLPLAAALVALALFIRTTGSPAGPRAALDEIAASGRVMIATLDTTALDDSARAAVRRHAEAIGRRTALARRAETLSRTAAAALAVAVLLGAGLVIGGSLLLARRWSAALSAPVEELVQWTRRIERQDRLPESAIPTGPPELDALRAALRDLAAALETARRRERERERLAAFRETARRVAHEMRGPINAMELALRQLSHPARDEPRPTKRDAATSVLTEETERLRRMADEFSAFGRLPEGPDAEIDVPELIDAVLAATVPDTIPVRRDVAGGLTLRGHYEALRRALRNVVQNAVEATDARGIAVSAGTDAGMVRIAVADHGPGVPPDLREKIFEPYTTRKAGGTGLGLALARQTAVAHRGDLSVEDDAGGGARFVFTLPSA